ncbi:MAG: TetR/AcrR family transcriptional regulator [Deltaproteobacteria bacterium]|nr:TetR/AcrR family transcriptional regulator [Deltaproteobacteria bacterium]
MALPALTPSTRERAGDATRARLFEAAVEEFRRVGFDAASVAPIARSAGVSRSNFYFHFPTKEQVLVELRYALELGIADRLKRCRSLREAFDALVDGLLEAEAIVASPELFRDMLVLSTRRPMGAPFDTEVFPTLVELTRHFEEGAVRGELRPGIDPQRAPLLCLASVHGVQVNVPEEDRQSDFEQLFFLYLAEKSP